MAEMADSERTIWEQAQRIRQLEAQLTAARDVLVSVREWHVTMAQSIEALDLDPEE